MNDTTESPAPLAASAREALAAYREQARLSAGARARLHDRIRGSIEARASRPARVAPPIDIGRSAWRIGVALAGAAAVLLALRALAGGDTAVSRDPGRAEGQAAYGADDTAPETTVPSKARLAPRTPAPAPAPAPTIDAPNVAAEGEAPVASPPSAPSARTPAVDPAAPRQPAPTADTTLAEEMEMMRSANAKLREGDPSAALDVLARHRERFPSGQMAEDREALQVRALCEAGQSERARAAAVAFVRSHPRSPHATRVEKICVAP